jgi:hypothetical protein
LSWIKSRETQLRLALNRFLIFFEKARRESKPFSLWIEGHLSTNTIESGFYMQITNFGQNVSFTPTAYYSPRSEDEVLDILAKHRGQSIRCIGRLHSWSRLIESDHVCLDLSNLQKVEPNSIGDTKVVDVGAGCQIKRLLAELDKQKQWTLPSVGFITEQSVAGAIATGTHGSGRHSLSHYVMSVRVARYDANGLPVIEEIAQGDELRAVRCSLGCLGVILSVRMQCRDTYRVEEHFREYRQLEEVMLAEEHFPLQQFYLVPWRWTLFAQHRRESSTKSSALMHVYHWYRFLVLDIAMHLLILLIVRIIGSGQLIQFVCRWVLASFVIRGWRVVAPSEIQLVMEHELFRHVELELFVQRRYLSSALEFVKQVLVAASESSAEIAPLFRAQLEQTHSTANCEQLRGRYHHPYPICVRKILPDDTLISMATNATSRTELESGTDERLSTDESWYSITLTNFQAPKSREGFALVAEMLTHCMSQLFGARPHWGKLNSLSVEELRSLYPAFESFRQICDKTDPHGAFRNAWIRRLIQPPTT